MFSPANLSPFTVYYKLNSLIKRTDLRSLILLVQLVQEREWLHKTGQLHTIQKFHCTNYTNSTLSTIV